MYSLPQSIEYSLKNHPSLAIHEQNVLIAREKSRQNIAGYLPQVNSSFTFVDNLALQTTVLPAGIAGPVSKEVQFGTRYNTSAGFDASQAVFDPVKLAAIKTGKPYREAALLQQKLNEESIICNTAVAYFQVLICREQLRLLEVNRKKYEDMLNILDYQYKKGVVLEKDADRVRVNLNSTVYQIDDVRSKETLALNNLKNAMGMPLDQPLVTTDSFHYESLAFRTGNDTLQPSSLLEAKISDKSVQLQMLSVKARKAAFSPVVIAFGKWATQSLSNDFSTAFSNWNSYSYIGLSVNFPLFNGLKRKSQLAEEKLKLRNQQTENRLTGESLKLRYENDKTAAGTAYSSYKSAKDNLELAKKILRVTDYQYQRGVAGLTDYLNDDSACKAAQSNYISSLYNLMIGLLNYNRSKGTLLSFINQIK